MAGISPNLLAELLERHAPALELYARQLCECPVDVVQEAFIELARQEVLPTNQIGWLYRVVRNKAKTAQRSARRRAKHEAAASELRRLWFVCNEEPLLAPQEVTVALRELVEEERELIVAHLWGQLTFEAVAELLGLSASTAHRRYQAALGRLREKLGVVCPTKPNDPAN